MFSASCLWPFGSRFLWMFVAYKLDNNECSSPNGMLIISFCFLASLLLQVRLIDLGSSASIVEAECKDQSEGNLLRLALKLKSDP